MHQSNQADPSNPNAAKVEETKSRFEGEILAPYELPGNRLAHDMYDHLLLPWNRSPPIDERLDSGFTRLYWDRDGKLSDYEHFFLGVLSITIEKMQKMMSTGSMVTRWREAHPQLVGTEQDVVAKMAKEMRDLLGEGEVVIGSSCVLLLFKKTDV